MSGSENIDALRSIIKSSVNIVFFGGAGVSTESNIPDFRSATGLYAGEDAQSYAPEEILSHTFFMKHPREFFAFYRSKMIYRDAKPNAAHLALAELEGRGKLKAVVTQNIDGLHQKAGSKKVLELHGSVHKNRCLSCGKFFSLEHILDALDIPRCDNCRGIVKPEVVLYEESLDEGVLAASVNCIAQAEVLLVGGTSLSVYPAAGLVSYYQGSKLVLINQSPTPYDDRADLLVCGRIGEVLGVVIQ